MAGNLQERVWCTLVHISLDAVDRILGIRKFVERVDLLQTVTTTIKLKAVEGMKAR